MPHVDQAPTRHEDLSTKPSCQQSYVDNWSSIIAPQPWNEIHLKFYYQMQAEVGQQITRVLDALRDTEAYENTIVIFCSDHGDMQGAHGGMHEKWHVAYEEALHVPFIVSSPLLPGGARELDIPTNHADLIPTLLGFAGIDPDEALTRVQSDHTDAHPLVGRDLSSAIRAAEPAAPTEPILFTTDDEISEGSATTASPFGRVAKALHRYSTVKQPNHLQTVIAEVDVDGEQHLVKFSRYYDNAQFWTVPGERDERLQGRETVTVTEPEPEEYELYDLTLDPTEEHNLAHPSYADDRSRDLQRSDARAPDRTTRRQAAHPVSRRDARLPAARDPLTGARRLDRLEGAVDARHEVVLAEDVERPAATQRVAHPALGARDEQPDPERVERVVDRPECLLAGHVHLADRLEVEDDRARRRLGRADSREEVVLEEVGVGEDQLGFEAMDQHAGDRRRAPDRPRGR